MTHQTVENKDGSVTTYFSEDDMPSPSQKDPKEERWRSPTCPI
jgi:hypothetical protein